MAIFDRRISNLILKHLRDELSPAETIELQEWVDKEDNKVLFDRLTQEASLREELLEYDTSKKIVWEKISSVIAGDKVVQMRRRRYRMVIAVAASIVILISAGIWFWPQHSVSGPAIESTQVAMQDDVAPGGDRALLTLSDGSQVSLDDVQNGLVVNEKGHEIMKPENGVLTYSPGSTEPGNTTINGSIDLPYYNTITTPRGGQYRVTLGDGTKVWLNAASSISYPVAFIGKERKVVITGEVYFEVAQKYIADNGSASGKDKVPFIVDIKDRGMQVEVLGTHFNINSYEDESIVRTTLLEGKVKINTQPASESTFLLPGQQAIVRSGSPAVRVENAVDTDEIMAWKNGLFQFKSERLETIMRQAARWYDIEVAYEGKMPSDKFTGKISRNVNLSQLLKILEYSDVSFKLLEGKRLVIFNE